MTARRCLPLLLALVFLVSAIRPVPGQEPPGASKPLDFAHDVVPILKRHCLTCHGGREREGGFSINTRAAILASGMIDAKRPESSHLLKLVRSRDPDQQMPPSDRPRVPAEEVAVLVRWVAEGLKWEDDFTFAVNAYEPPLHPRRPELPPATDGRGNPIDRILDAYTAARGLPRPAPIDDATFARRVHLDLIGLLPAPQKLQEFLRDPSPDKRERLIDELLADNLGYADHWLSFFNDLLRNDYSGTGFITGGRRQVSKWLYQALLENKPFDQMARELIAPPTDESRGYIDGIKWRGEVSAGQTIEIQFAQSVSQSFLGINLKCASCHDSFIDRWTLKEAYGLAAIYARQPLKLHRCDKPTGEIASAAWLFPELGDVDPAAAREQRLEQLARLMTHPQNGRFPRTIVNRLWYRLMGRGIVHPLDAMQTEPWNEDLLDYLAVDFTEHKFDLKAALRLIASSQAYQSQTEVVENANELEYIYRGPRARRMTAEQLVDAIWQLTGDAPAKFDAPVLRSVGDPQAAAAVELKGKWIWGKLTGNAAPGGERIVLHKRFDVPAAVAAGGAIITCDNGFRLYINRREVLGGDDWTKVQSALLGKRLKTGANEIAVVATNAGSGPNPAGLYFEARLTLEDGRMLTLMSDESWKWSSVIPPQREGRLGALRGELSAVTVADPVAPWTQVLESQGRTLLAAVQANRGDAPMVRAALLKNTPLMQSLGRPIRDQIVSMRPTTLTTLEAIDLANEPQLAATFAAGARNLLQRPWKNADELVEYLFQAALCRPPTSTELAVFREALGEEPAPETLQDALWAVCMLPEFLLVR